MLDIKINKNINRPYQFFLFTITLLFSFNLFANDKVKIIGVDKKFEQNILAFLNPESIECKAEATRIDSFIQQVERKTLMALRPFGYYAAKINVTLNTKNSDCWSITIDIKLDKPVLIRKKIISLLGDAKSDIKFSHLINQSSLVENQIFKSEDYEQLKSDLLKLASEKGYLDAIFSENQIDVYPEKYAADILLTFSSGVRYRIDSIEIEQEKEFLNKSFIQDLINLKKGQHFTSNNLYQIRKKMNETGYFERVSLTLDSENKKNGRVPLKVSITPSKRIKYSLGLGFSTDIGPKLSLDYKNDRISKQGYQFQSKLSLSKVISELTAGIKIPSKHKPTSTWYQLDVGFRHEDTGDTISDTSKIGVSQTTIRPSQWQSIHYIDLIHEKFQAGLNQSDEESFLLIPGTNWSLLKADNPILPSQGYKIQVALRGTSKALYSDASFTQLNFNYKGISSFFGNSRVLYRMNLATTLTDDFSDIPASYRYYAGGDNSIRGFDYRSLSPIDSDNNLIGGKHLAVISLEYEYRYNTHWGLALFSDAGNAFGADNIFDTDNTSNDNFSIEQSVGIGVRWFSPVGPIRFDIATALTSAEDQFRIHIALGPDL